MDGLQYYSVATGADTAKGGLVVSGGLQDNGASNLRGVKPYGRQHRHRDGLPLRW